MPKHIYNFAAEKDIRKNLKITFGHKGPWDGIRLHELKDKTGAGVIIRG